ncbi:MAG TPA: DUF502 domain-containing protein [Vicinamibacteria bacterium]|nr:DUF502 domain-containing protein [Vicinamibacteria bacterium]
MAASDRFKKSFIAGLIVVLPLLVSGLVLVWVARLIEGAMSPLLEWLVGRSIPGLGFASALLLVAVVGLAATTVVGSRLLGHGEHIVARIPLFKDIYVPVKQLVSAFSPENESGFKRVVLVPYAGTTGLTLGFLTREFQAKGANGTSETWASVYVPTNHLYLGSILCYPWSDLRFPDLSVEEAVRIALTGGTAFPDMLREREAPPALPK